MNDLLGQIQRLQFDQRSEAERLLLGFVNETFPDLDVVAVQLRPQAVSLNSFNGFLTLRDGSQKFFKTHTEDDNVIDEYYNAQMLEEAGYPVLKPIRSSTTAGQHLLIYEVIEAPSVFDVAWAIETDENAADFDALTQAQHDSDDQLFAIYEQSLEQQSEVDAARAPIHQLFYHRLVGGRLDRFYGDANASSISLPFGTFAMADVRRWRWQINGQVYDGCLDDIIDAAIKHLKPAQSDWSIVGHGDAHNGNVFFHGDHLSYFDPAFAGRHHPLLDLTKPLFHNVFAMWMYYPEVKKHHSTISGRLDENRVIVDYDYALPSVRQMFLHSKVERVLVPTLNLLSSNDALRDDWRFYLKLALFCCPFLTLNLADKKRFPPEISLLGLAMAVEMGAESKQVRSTIDRILDDVEERLKDQ